MIDFIQGALAVAGLFGLGWATHAFFHRREHDALKKRVAELEEKVTKGVDVRVKIQEVTAESLEKDNKIAWMENEIKRLSSGGPTEDLNEEQADVLYHVHRGRDGLSFASNKHGDRYSLVLDQLAERELISWGVEGPFCLPKGRKVLDELGQI